MNLFTAKQLGVQKVILASASPRRKELLSAVLQQFDILPAHINEEEEVGECSTPEETVSTLALRKAQTIAKHYPESLIIAADTVVSIHGTILNKPKDVAEAERMLRMLSDSVHEVYTGVCIEHPHSLTSVWAEKTEVGFIAIPDAVMQQYINSGKPMDKAGAYGIQDDFGTVVTKYIKGSFTNVIGLPIGQLTMELQNICNSVILSS